MMIPHSFSNTMVIMVGGPSLPDVKNHINVASKNFCRSKRHDSRGTIWRRIAAPEISPMAHGDVVCDEVMLIRTETKEFTK